MSRLLYFDCFSGIAGDMTCAALLALTGAEKELRRALRGLPVRGYSLSVGRASSGGIAGTRVSVKVSARKKSERPLSEILSLLGQSKLPASVRERAVSCFELLAGAEAKVHGTTKERVHFHEVGATDAIVDIVAACFLFEHMGAPDAYGSALPGGSGEAWSSHGTIPVPGPATLALLTGAPWRLGEGDGELVTPTGAAILRAFGVSFERPPEMIVRGVGIGVGHREIPGRANILRVVEGDTVPGSRGRDRVLEVEANIDDMNPQRFELLMERAFGAGALDVAVLPATMKKNRPGWVLRILCPEERLEIVSAAVFSLSTAIGLRYHSCDRLKLARRTATVETRFGTVRVKEAELPDGSVRPIPEYDDVRRIVRAGRGSFEEVAWEVAKKWRR
ncbi:MAG TPA: nickel pincer cofactor biosynthesis protein LarC [Candidatus Deferrimicrobiaceae bacterium]|nr:nickel pincer cofactor biosynthesis protein LarC [Candidatus Deferrimicrobiaceae bacterium]